LHVWLTLLFQLTFDACRAAGKPVGHWECFVPHCANISIAAMCCSQGEIFAAEGYAKVTGDVGVCIATSGPGATNLVTGLADALLDSVPLVAITGQVSSKFSVVLSCAVAHSCAGAPTVCRVPA
jgi:Thiamine pyrophosphate enzyme, N-terminal TPP binding domain